jgi:hypothetical protein
MEGKAAGVPGRDESMRFLPNRLETPGNKAFVAADFFAPIIAQSLPAVVTPST